MLVRRLFQSWFHLLRYFVRSVLINVLTGSQSCIWWFSTTQASSTSTCSTSAVDFSSCLNEWKNIQCIKGNNTYIFYFKLKNQLTICTKVFFFLISNVLKAMCLNIFHFPMTNPAVTNDETSLRIPRQFILLK